MTSSSLGHRASLGVSPHISGICHSNNSINKYTTLIIEPHQYCPLTITQKLLISYLYLVQFDYSLCQVDLYLQLNGPPSLLELPIRIV